MWKSPNSTQIFKHFLIFVVKKPFSTPVNVVSVLSFSVIYQHSLYTQKKRIFYFVILSKSGGKNKFHLYSDFTYV